jgi:hypothetical protein
MPNPSSSVWPLLLSAARKPGRGAEKAGKEKETKYKAAGGWIMNNKSWIFSFFFYYSISYFLL